MHKLTMFLGREMKDDSGILNAPDGDGVILGQLSERQKEKLLEYLGAAQEGRLETFIDGKRYKVTEVRSTGEFRAEPNFVA